MGGCRCGVVWAGVLVCMLRTAGGQAVTPTLPDAPQPATATLQGNVTDTDGAFIPGTKVALEDAATKAVLRTETTDGEGAYNFRAMVPGRYTLRFKANGFSGWKVEDVALGPAAELTVPTVMLGVESIDASVNAIFSEDLAEQEITAEEHQRILGILPNFFVSYVAHAQPLTRRQKFKLAAVVSTDPLTLMTTGITAGIEQAEGDFSGYGPGFGGYAQRYAATYGDRLSATFLGSAALPSLLHQDPRYFYSGKGSVVRRALYAVSTVVICKGDNGRWQPNYSNVGGNIGAAYLSGLYYPRSDQHTAQVTVDNALLGLAEGSIGTLLQEFLLRHVTHGAPPVNP
jgi:hypothetical protein